MHVPLVHKSAKPSHYNKEAESYDGFNEKKSAQINQLIEKILREYGVKTVLDLTCGTGSQVFWLTEHGYEVVGVDINRKMLEIAKNKAKQKQLPLKFLKGDMRTTHVGEFDAAITIFNSIGHLTRADFETTIQNIYNNLKNNGLYIFDIFNLTYLLEGNNITKLTIDWQTIVDDTKFREIQYSTVSEDGALASHDIYYEQKGSSLPKVSRSSQTLQTYTPQQLREMLTRNNFTVLNQCKFDGSKLNEGTPDRIVTIAQKNI